MNLIKKVVSYCAVGVMAICLFSFPVSCDNRNIHQVVKEMAASPVDTVGWHKKSMVTNPFSSVDIDCFADVTYHQTPAGGEHFIELKAQDKVLENIDVRVEDGNLQVSIDRRYKMPEKAVAVVNIYAPFVNRFILDGGKCLRLGEISLTCPLELMVDGNVGTMISDSISAHEVSLLLEGTGSFHLKGIRTGNVRAKIVGDGSVCLEGRCLSVKPTIRGNGKIDISALSCDTVVSEEIIGKGIVLQKK